MNGIPLYENLMPTDGCNIRKLSNQYLVILKSSYLYFHSKKNFEVSPSRGTVSFQVHHGTCRNGRLKRCGPIALLTRYGRSSPERSEIWHLCDSERNINLALLFIYTYSSTFRKTLKSPQVWGPSLSKYTMVLVAMRGWRGVDPLRCWLTMVAQVLKG